MNLLILQLFEILLEHYGPQKWWPCQSGARWEIITGVILAQNTAWTNVEKAIANLLAVSVMSPDSALATPDDELQELIRPTGFFKQKCAYLKAMAAFMLEHEDEFEQSADVWALRKQLLSVKGVGRETADSILLYAFNKPIFVIDAYTRRVAERHLRVDGSVHYDILQKTFMDALPPDTAIFNEYHALIVALCKESCRKSGCGEICSEIICLGKLFPTVPPVIQSMIFFISKRYGEYISEYGCLTIFLLTKPFSLKSDILITRVPI